MRIHFISGAIRRPNIGRTTTLACLLGTIGCASLALSACGTKNTPDTTADADALLKAGNLEQAAAAYQALVDADDSNAPAHAGLGIVLARQKRPDEALAHLRNAIKLDPRPPVPYIEAARILLEQDKLEEAAAITDQLAEIEPENGAILRAMILRAQGKTADAVALLEPLVEKQPDSAPLRINLAISLLAAGQPEKAESVLGEIVKRIDPDSLPARMLLVESLRLQGRLADMIGELDQVASQQPENQGAKLSLALALLDQGDAQKALDLVKPIVEKNPGAPWPRYVLGCALLKSGDRESALRELEFAANALPDQSVVHDRLAAARAAGAPSPAATPVAADASTSGTADWTELWLHARLGELVANRATYPADATHLPEILVMSALFLNNLPLLDELVQPLPQDSPVRAYVAAFKDLLGPQTDPELARTRLDALGKALKSLPEDSPEAIIIKDNAEGFALAAMGQRSAAFAKYSETLRKSPQNGVALRNLASMYRAADMHEFSAAAFQRLVNTHGNSLELRRLLFEAFDRARMETEAVAFAEATYAIQPGDPDVVANLARLYLQVGNDAAAKNLLEVTIKEQPDQDPLRILLANAQLRSGDPKAALDTLDATTVPGHLVGPVQEIRAFAHALLAQWDQALQVLEGPGQDKPSLALQILKASALARAGTAQEALAALPAPDTVPEAFRSTIALLRHAFGDEAGAALELDQALAQALRQNPQYAVPFAFAMAQRNSQLFASAYDTLLELNKAIPNQPRLLSYTLDSLSRPRIMPNRMAAAESLVEGHESVADAWAGLASVYRAEEHTEGERAAIDRAVAIAPQRMDIINQAAQFAIRHKDNALAMDMYNRLVALDAENPTILNNHAYFLLETGGSNEVAAENAQKALDIVPGNPQIMHTLGLAKLRLKKLDEADKLLGRAPELRPGDPTLTLDYGNLLIEQGKTNDGKRLVQIAIIFARQLNLDFPRLDEALEVLGVQSDDPSVAPTQPA